MLLTLLYIFIGIVIVQLFYYLGIFREFVFSQPAENNPKRIPVSVILYAKNNAGRGTKNNAITTEPNLP
ncbi:hypothetical protein QW060_24880 [Myroides ceti]|uniref:Glycosyltransferase n=1 Tax=Paenimyroides ceti TaxID=395087 RepID=A0ABT8D2J1_9FLAO|nr:hypothetical protein [Paenimyroides ceti]MDN3710121.1 hypothetical protein [Paenimyroides ceti]